MQERKARPGVVETSVGFLSWEPDPPTGPGHRTSTHPTMVEAMDEPMDEEVMCDADQRTPKYADVPPRHLPRSPLTLLIGTAPLRST